MSLRGLVLLLALLAALIGGVAWLDRRDARKTPDPIEAKLFRAFASESVRSVALACEGSTVKLKRVSATEWRLEEPAAALADSRRVDELLSALRDAREAKSIGNGASQLGAFGLDPPVCRVQLLLDNEPTAITLRLGRASPVGTERYAAGDDGKIVLAGGSLYAVVSRNAESFREKRAIPADAEAITRIVVDRPEGRLVLAFTSGAWRIEAPRADLASTPACTGLARALVAIPVNDPAPSPHVTVEVTVSGREAPLAADVAPDAAPELARPWESFQETRIASFSIPEVRRLSLSRGDTSLRLDRTAEGAPWTGSDGSAPFPVDATRITELLDRLRGLTADGFEGNVPASKAEGTIVVSGEKGELARWVWGPLDANPASKDHTLWVTTPSRPGVVFRVGASRLEPLPQTKADLGPQPVGVRQKHRIDGLLFASTTKSSGLGPLFEEFDPLRCPTNDDRRPAQGFPPRVFAKVERKT